MDKFSYETNGYNREEVNQFVGDVIKQTEGIVKKYRSQKEEIKQLQEKLSHYERSKILLKKSLINAEKTGDNIKQLAREEANTIIHDAKNNASRIVNEALLKSQ